jgi:hypothetical protein
MALSNYSDLLSAVSGWLNRGSDLDTRIPDFIKLAEAEFNRKLRTLEMEITSTATLTGDAIAVPTDFLGLRSIKIDNTALEYVAPSEIYDNEATGSYPTRYTVTDGQFVFRPAPSSGSVEIAYYGALPALTVSNTTNWLMTRWPDLYLFAVCAQAEFYVWNDPRVPLWKARAEEIMEQINRQTFSERHGGRRLAAQHRVGQVSTIRA